MNEVVSILGLGLMGGSLGLALRRRAPGIRVVGWGRRAETRQQALALGAVTEIAETPADAVRAAGIVVLCSPVRSIPELAASCAPGLRPGSVVTDVGSTKSWVVSACAAALAGSPSVFVGSHPMAGSERAGLSAARADLYENARVIVTGAGEPADRVEALWTAAGARVVRMTAGAHDALAARVSHGPHLAAALAAAAAAREGADAGALGEIAGAGFRDTTRVADGSPDLWTDIVSTNAGPVLEWMEAAAAGLGELRAAVRAERWEEVRDWLSRARMARRRVIERAGDPAWGEGSDHA